MDINITARHFNASAGLQSRVQDEIEKLGKFYPNITSASVVLDQEVEHMRRCEISLNIKGSVIVASADEENMGKAIDTAIERAKTQLKKHNEKQKDHKTQSLSELVNK